MNRQFCAEINLLINLLVIASQKDPPLSWLASLDLYYVGITGMVSGVHALEVEITCKTKCMFNRPEPLRLGKFKWIFFSQRWGPKKAHPWIASFEPLMMKHNFTICRSSWALAWGNEKKVTIKNTWTLHFIHVWRLGLLRSYLIYSRDLAEVVNLAKFYVDQSRLFVVSRTALP